MKNYYTRGGTPPQFGISGIGLWGPGLPGWDAARSILRNDSPYAYSDTRCPPPSLLPGNELRRASAVVRLALHVSESALRMSRLEPASVRNVFASSNGDGGIVHTILEVLARNEDVSPTGFHNSVHNAAAGYWTIAQSSRQATTALGCYDDSFSAGLLKAGVETVVEQQPVLLCVYDAPLPPPLHACRPLSCAFAVALVLVPDQGSICQLTISLDEDSVPSQTQTCALHPSLAKNPACQSLELLALLALEKAGRLQIPYLDSFLRVEIMAKT
jgi:hypothetical protein